MPPTTPDPRDQSYEAVVERVAAAARKFREAAGVTESDATAFDVTHPLLSAPSPGVVCLQLAITLWQTCRPNFPFPPGFDPEWGPAQMAAQMGAGFAGPPPRPYSPEHARIVRRPETPPDAAE